MKTPSAQTEIELLTQNIHTPRTSNHPFPRMQCQILIKKYIDICVVLPHRNLG